MSHKRDPDSVPVPKKRFRTLFYSPQKNVLVQISTWVGQNGTNKPEFSFTIFFFGDNSVEMHEMRACKKKTLRDSVESWIEMGLGLTDPLYHFFCWACLFSLAWIGPYSLLNVAIITCFPFFPSKIIPRLFSCLRCPNTSSFFLLWFPMISHSAGDSHYFCFDHRFQSTLDSGQEQ